MKNTASLFLLGLLVTSVVLGAAVLGTSEQKKEYVSQARTEDRYDTLATSTLPVTVSGVVEPTTSIQVYAQTAGVIAHMPVTEGSTVRQSSLLFQQRTPVASARTALTDTEAALTSAQQTSNRVSAKTQAAQAIVRAYSAAEVAELRVLGNDHRVQESSEALITALELSITDALSVIDYMNNNRPLFSSEGLRAYDQVVSELYGTIPDYFSNGLRRGNTAEQDLIAGVRTLTTDEHSSPADVHFVALLFLEQLRKLSAIFPEAEYDVFDRQQPVPTSTETYLETRQTVVRARTNLEEAASRLQRAFDNARQDAEEQHTSVAVTDIDRNAANAQAELAHEIANRAEAVAAASQEFARAEQSLGVVTAPFAGEVSKVLVDTGTYVTAGQPVLSLIGTDGREVSVTIPAAFTEALEIGQTFFVDGVPAGQVDRIHPVAIGGSTTVIILLTDGYQIGQSIKGTLPLPAQNGMFTVLRDFVHFDNDGPYVQYQNGLDSDVEVLYDTGNKLFVRVHEVHDTPIVPHAGVTF